MGEERNTQTDRNPYLYTGKEQDIMTGLYYYEQRYYDPSKSTFLGVDPMAEKFQYQSSFAYADNNPIRFIDVMGMNAEEPDGPLWDGLVQRGKGGRVEFLDKDLNTAPGRLVLLKGGTTEDGDKRASGKGTDAVSAPDVGGDNWAVTAAASYLMFLQIDLVTPDPSDVVLPKWLGHAVLGTISAVILYAEGKKILNPNLEGTTTSRGNPTDWNFDPEINMLQNDKYYPPGSKPPRWFWPAVGAAGAFELYENWPKQNTPQSTTRENVPTRPIYPAGK